MARRSGEQWRRAVETSREEVRRAAWAVGLSAVRGPARAVERVTGARRGKALWISPVSKFGGFITVDLSSSFMRKSEYA